MSAEDSFSQTSHTTLSAPDEVTAALLVIGDEILSGRTKDKNIGFLAERCTELGIRLKEVRIVPDDEAEIITALNALRAKFTYVFTTGGIGPTHDDITADAMARAFCVTIDVDERAVKLMQGRYGQIELTPARLRMARIPAGADLIENAVSAAPGFWLGNVIVMAGVPAVMQSMFEAVSGRLKTGAKLLSETVKVNIRESVIAAPLEACQKAYPKIAMGSYPFNEDGCYGAHLVLRSSDAALLAQAKQDLLQRLQALDIKGE